MSVCAPVCLCVCVSMCVCILVCLCPCAHLCVCVRVRVCVCGLSRPPWTHVGHLGLLFCPCLSMWSGCCVLPGGSCLASSVSCTCLLTSPPPPVEVHPSWAVLVHVALHTGLVHRIAAQDSLGSRSHLEIQNRPQKSSNPSPAPLAAILNFSVLWGIIRYSILIYISLLLELSTLGVTLEGRRVL